jgi:hypothetical protein
MGESKRTKGGAYRGKAAIFSESVGDFGLINRREKRLFIRLISLLVMSPPPFGPAVC